jgi:hypothetical protein
MIAVLIGCVVGVCCGFGLALRTDDTAARLRRELASHLVTRKVDTKTGDVSHTSCMGCNDYKDNVWMVGRIEPLAYPHKEPCPLVW